MKIEISHNPNPDTLLIMETLKRMYHGTNNGVFVWQAIVILKKCKDKYGTFEMPQWVYDYLFDCADELTASCQDNIKTPIAKIFEMETVGQGEAFSQNRTKIIQIYAVNRIDQLTRKKDKKTRIQDIHNQVINELEEIFNEDITDGTLKTWKSKYKKLVI